MNDECVAAAALRPANAANLLDTYGRLLPKLGRVLLLGDLFRSSLLHVSSTLRGLHWKNEFWRQLSSTKGIRLLAVSRLDNRPLWDGIASFAPNDSAESRQ